MNTNTRSISTTSSSSSSLVRSRYGLLTAGRNFEAVMMKKMYVASSKKNSSSHSYLKGTVIYKKINV